VSSFAYRDKKVVGVFVRFLRRFNHQTVDIVIANSLTYVVQITKNLVKKKGRMAQIILVSHQVIQPPSPMPPYSFKNTKILTCGMPVVGLYLQQPPLSCALTSIIHLMY
jgi:hypothetical protein